MLGAIHLGRLAYPGRGVLENRTSIVIFTGILLFNPDRRGRGVWGEGQGGPGARSDF